jgi:hypothetical protein
VLGAEARSGETRRRVRKVGVNRGCDGGLASTCQPAAEYPSTTKMMLSSVTGAVRMLRGADVGRYAEQDAFD